MEPINTIFFHLQKWPLGSVALCINPEPLGLHWTRKSILYSRFYGDTAGHTAHFAPWLPIWQRRNAGAACQDPSAAFGWRQGGWNLLEVLRSEYRGVLLSYSYLVAVFSFITILISHHHHRGHSSPSSWGHQQEWFSPCWPCSDFSTFPLIIHERVCLCHGREELRFTYQKQQHQQQQRPSTSYNTVPLRTSWLPPAAFIFLIHKGTPSWIYKQNPLIKSNCFGDWYRRFSIVCVFFSDVH